MSVERLGVTVIPGAGWRASDIRDVARAAEEAGFEAIFTTEVNNDALATAQLMGNATAHIQVGTWIANIYLRHPYTCAKGASLIADDTAARLSGSRPTASRTPAAPPMAAGLRPVLDPPVRSHGQGSDQGKQETPVTHARTQPQAP